MTRRGKNNIVHVLIGQFDSRDSATRYTEPQWSPEPDDSASDEAYAEWEETNPSHELAADLGVYLDEDYVETLWGDVASHREYLASILVDNTEIATLGGSGNTMVLIFGGAINETSTIRTTPQVHYCGAFRCDLGKGF